MNTIPSTELFLASIPNRKVMRIDSDSFVVSIPNDTPSLEDFRSMLKTSLLALSAFHHRRILIWSLIVPLTIPVTLLPMPNIPLFLVLFRIWSHNQARKGSDCFHTFLVKDKVEFLIENDAKSI